MQALSKAIGVIGSQRGLAERCGVVQTAVAAWLKRGTVPPEHCALIEQATNGVVSRRELRPLDWQKIWPELADELPTEEALAARANVAAEQGIVDRRDPASVNPFPDLDRRAVGQGV